MADGAIAMDHTTKDDPLGIVGTTIDGKYTIDGLIGEGGAAVVYRATNREWDVKVALKFYLALANAPLDVRDKLLEEFIQEGRLMGKLSSRSAAVVQPRDMGAITRSDGSWIPYLALEWLEGSPLDYVLVGETEKGIPPRTLEETMHLLEPAASALEIAHRENIVHRDIKPENLFVLGDPRGGKPRMKIFDFGIAKVMQDSIGVYVHTAAAATPFTPHYGAPEQFSRSYGPTGPWTDVFAFALVVLEVMRGGDRVFAGGDYVELSLQSRSEDVRPTPRVLGLEVNDDVEAVFARALALRPEDRYPTAGEFWGSLYSAVFPQRATWQTEASLVPPSVANVPGSTRVAANAAPGSSRALVIGAGIVGVLALACVGIFVAKSYGGAADASARTALPVVASAPASAVVATVSSSASTPVAVPARICAESADPVAGGRFTMGNENATNANPPHGVILDAFCLDRAEVTVKAYQACVVAGSCAQPTTDIQAAAGAPTGEAKACPTTVEGHEGDPITCVSADDADRYCAFAKMRLPTEAEWEFAASKAKLDGSSVGKGEWTGDMFGPYGPDDAVNPKGSATGTDRVVRGVKAGGKDTQAKASERASAPPNARNPGIGFRCASNIAHA